MPVTKVLGIAQVILSAVGASVVSGLWQPDPQLLALLIALQSAFGGGAALKQHQDAQPQ